MAHRRPRSRQTMRQPLPPRNHRRAITRHVPLGGGRAIRSTQTHRQPPPRRAIAPRVPVFIPFQTRLRAALSRLAGRPRGRFFPGGNAGRPGRRFYSGNPRTSRAALRHGRDRRTRYFESRDRTGRLTRTVLRRHASISFVQQIRPRLPAVEWPIGFGPIQRSSAGSLAR